MIRELLPYGYETHTGVVPTDRQIDQYNRIQEEINSWLRARRPVPEHLLDESHRCFTLMSEKAP